MINTIFYFPLAKLTYSDYAAAVQNGEISGRTIVLDKVSGKIFNQGKEYGYSKLEIDESVDRKIDDVKNDMSDVVDELNNTLDDLNDHIDDVNNNLDNVIDSLDDSIQDKVEDMVSDSEWIQQNWPQGVTQYDSGWNENVKAYLLTVGLWDYGDDGSIVTKWSQLRQSVNNVSSEVNQVTKQGGRLDTLQSAINQEITDRGEAITQLSNTYTNTDAQTKKVLEWMYSGLKSSASANKSFNELYSAANSGDTTAISGLRTDITNQLGNYVASTDLSSRVEGVLKNGAGVTSLANLAQKSDITSATNTLVATYKLNGLYDSVSGLRQRADASEARLDIVTKLGENNTYTYNKSTLDLAVAGIMAETTTETYKYLSGLQVTSGDGEAAAELASSINNNKNDIARLATKITGNSSDATVEAKLNGMSASLVTTSTLDTALVNVLATNNSGSAASIKTLAGNSSAVTGLSAEVNGVKSTIDAIVDGSGSSVMVKANKIQLDGRVIANKLKTLNTLLVGNDESLHFVTTTEGDSDEQRGLIFYNLLGTDVGAFYIDSNGYLQLRLLGPDGSMYNIDWSNMNKMTTTVQTPIHQWNLVGGYGVISNSTDPSRFPNTYLFNLVLGDMTDYEISIIKGIYSNDSSRKVPVYKYQTNYPEELNINGYFSKGLLSTPPTGTVEEGYYTCSGESSDLVLCTRLDHVYRWLNSTYSDNDLIDYELLPLTLSDMNYIIEESQANAGWSGSLYLGTEQDGNTLTDPVYIIGLMMRHCNSTLRVAFLINKSVYDSIPLNVT